MPRLPECEGSEERDKTNGQTEPAVPGLPPAVPGGIQIQRSRSVGEGHTDENASEGLCQGW